MKKLLLVILVLFGLNQTQAQVQINWCDSTFIMASTNSTYLEHININSNR